MHRREVEKVSPEECVIARAHNSERTEPRSFPYPIQDFLIKLRIKHDFQTRF